jgi:DNA-binding HxlR family transcriptional regulator
LRVTPSNTSSCPGRMPTRTNEHIVQKLHLWRLTNAVMLYPMKGYGQFCPVALAAEVFAERWTPLILRELLCGARRFAEIHRGVPRISRNLLCQRLDALAHSGIIERKPIAQRRGFEYHLSDAGREFGPVIESLGVWGYKWSSRDLRDENLDPDFLMWVLHRLVRTENLPDHRVVVFFRFNQAPKRRYWLILNRPEIDVCLFDPGFEIDLEVVADVRALANICLGHLSVVDAVRRGAVTLNGARQFCKKLPTWLGTAHYASAIAS